MYCKFLMEYIYKKKTLKRFVSIPEKTLKKDLKRGQRDNSKKETLATVNRSCHEITKNADTPNQTNENKSDVMNSEKDFDL